MCSVASRVSSIRSLLLGLDSQGGNDPVGKNPLLCKRIARELASKLTVIFRHLEGG